MAPRDVRPEPEPVTRRFRLVSGAGPLVVVLALITVFVLVAIGPRKAHPPAAPVPALARVPLEPIGPPATDLTVHYEPVTQPATDLTARFEPPSQPQADLTVRYEPPTQPPTDHTTLTLEPVTPPAAVVLSRPPGRAGGDEMGEELPLFVQAVDREIDEEQLIIALSGENARRRAAARAIAAGQPPPRKGGIAGLKDGFTGLADSFEDLFTGKGSQP